MPQKNLDLPTHLKKRVGTWASLEDGQDHVPTLLSEEWARGRVPVPIHQLFAKKLNEDHSSSLLCHLAQNIFLDTLFIFHYDHAV